MDGANNLSAGVETGEIVECTVEQIMPYGAFVRISKNGKKGMIHISELSYSFVKDVNDVLKISDKIQAKIIRIDDRGRIDLSIKQTAEPPAPQPAQKFAKRMPPVNRENFRPKKDFVNVNDNESDGDFQNFGKSQSFRDFHEMREAYREKNPDEADSFEKKMASFLKTSEAKITDLNTRNSARSGRSTRRRNNRDH